MIVEHTQHAKFLGYESQGDEQYNDREKAQRHEDVLRRWIPLKC